MFSTRPTMGTSIISAILTAFSTTMLTSSWGEATMMIPSRGMDWNTDNDTTPVPGGIYTNRKSQFHSTSVHNCFTTPEMTVPRQMTGSVSLASSSLVDIT